MKNIERKKDNFISDATMLLFLNLFASGLNYIYQILIAKALSVESFGMVNTVFSFMLIIAVPGNTITMLTGRYLAIGKESKAYNFMKTFVKKITVLVTVLGLAVCVLGFLNYGILKEVLRIKEPWIIVITIVICSLGYYHPLYSGCMNGLKKFLPLGLYGILIPVYKLLGLSIAIFLKEDVWRLGFCLFAIIPGSILTAIIGYIYIKNELSKFHEESENDTVVPKKIQWIDSFVLNIGLVLYTNIDILAVRYIGGEELSGIYSSVTLFGRMVFYVASAIGTVLLPLAAIKKPKEAYSILKKALVVVGGISTLGLIVLNCLKYPLVNIIYGDRYLSATTYIIYVSLISFVTGLLTIMVNYFVGVNYTKVPRIFLVILSVIIMLIIFFAKRVEVALILIAVTGFLCAMGIFIRYRKEIS